MDLGDSVALVATKDVTVSVLVAFTAFNCLLFSVFGKSQEHTGVENCTWFWIGDGQIFLVTV